MSTISDALKKAQKQRVAGLSSPAPVAPEPPPDGGRGHAHPVPLPLCQSGKPSFLLIFICVAAIVGGLVLYFGRGVMFSVSRNTDGVTVRVSDIPSAPDPMPKAMAGVAMTNEGQSAGRVEESVIQATDTVLISPPPPKAIRADIPKLGGIFYSEKNPVAILNGSAMKEGEMIGAFQVVKIAVYSVTLKCDGEDIELRLR